MKRFVLALTLLAGLALMSGCSKPKEVHVRMDFKGTPGVMGRGFWLTKPVKGHPETKYEIGAMVPSWKSWDVYGVKYIYIRKLTPDGRFELTVTVDEDVIFEASVTERNGEIIYNPKD